MDGKDHRRKLSYSWSWKRYILPLHKTFQRVIFVLIILSLLFIFYYLFKSVEETWKAMRNPFSVLANYRNIPNSSIAAAKT